MIGESSEVLRGRLLKLVRKARDASWNPGSTILVATAADEFERAVQQEQVDAALGRAKGIAARTVTNSVTPKVFGNLTADERDFVAALAERCGRKGASLTAQKGYGMLLVRASRVDGTHMEANVVHLTDIWCSYQGDVMSVQDLARRMANVRKPHGTSGDVSGENRPHEDPDGFAKDAPRRVRKSRKLPPAGNSRRL